MVMKEKKGKKSDTGRVSGKPKQAEEVNLCFQQKESEKITSRINNEMKKNLWGLEQDRQKIIKIIELALEKLDRIQELKNIEKRLSSTTESEEKKVQAEYFDFIEQERRKFKGVFEKLSDVKGKEKMEPASNKAPAASKKPKERAKILIVEDEYIIIKSISYFLVGAGYDVVFALNAQEGLMKAVSEMPDLIILDIIMPGMNGYQILARIRKDKRISHIPVIILSALSREEDILEGLEKGADDYLTKPFSPEILVSKANKVLSEGDGDSSSSRL